MPDINNASRIKGSIFGLACTDALGAPVEFKMRGTFDLVDRYIPNDNFGTGPGTWTDDTSMALCMAQAIIDHNGRWIPQAVIRNWVDWYRNGYLSATGRCFDIGNATRSALAGWDEFFKHHPEIVKDSPDAHREGQDMITKFMNKKSFCGNGALMRIAPLPLVYNRTPSKLQVSIEQSAEATHPYPLNAACCVIHCHLIAACFEITHKAELATLIPDQLKAIEAEHPDLLLRLDKYRQLSDWVDQPSEGIRSSGFVVDTLEAALWAFFSTSTFRDGAIKVVNLGDDADTVGAVYGGLAGAFYGYESIPSEWLSGLAKYDIVARIADGLIKTETEIETE